MRDRIGLREAAMRTDFQVIALLVVAVIFGAGGAGFGLNNLIVQLCAILILAANYPAVLHFARSAPRLLVALVLVSLALPILHAVPLPPSLWQALPGRDIVIESLSLIGKQDGWFPLSLDRGRTIGAVVALLPPLAVLVLAFSLERKSLNLVAVIVIGLAVASFVVGAILLLVSGLQVGNVYGIKPGHALGGFFANRNSNALFMVVALAVLLLGRWHAQDDRARHLRLAAAALVVVGILLSQSRAGALLGLLVLVIWLVRSIPRLRSGFQEAPARKRLIAAAIFALAGIGVVGLALTNDRLGDSFARFAQDDMAGDRWVLVQDGVASAQRFWPVGAGVGTFDEVFQIDESLEYLIEPRAGRAHNEYLEVAIEAGIVGLALVLGWLFWALRAGWRLRTAYDRGLAPVAFLALCLIALHAIVSFPLRNEALLCVTAFLVAIVARHDRPGRQTK